MRRMRSTLASIGLVALLSGTAMLACSNTQEDCAKTNSCGAPGTISSSSSGGGGNPVDTCAPSAGQASIGPECGIFVSSSKGSDTNAGSPDAPVQTMATAIALADAGPKRVYACAEEFAEAVTLPGGVSLYGGFDCSAGFHYAGDPMKTTINGPADMAALTITGGLGAAHASDLKAKAPDASIPGGSSVAVIVDGVTTHFERCDFEAGAGRDGDNGAPQDPLMPADPTDPAIKGADGMNACLNGAADTPGGDAKVNAACPASIGGKGGAGLVDTGANGEDGQPLPDPNPGGFGLGGVGAGMFPCKTGELGLPGDDGLAGTGAEGLGSLSAAGFMPAAGADGTAGAPGNGGGGGGGAKGKMSCAGASGGGGGAGGCGGAGGKGGAGGGSSIALISLAAQLSFASISLTAAAGGKGGDGADGQFGGIGGSGGAGGMQTSGTLKGCTGGEGGSGGAGGKGGGGRGGHSLGIAYTGSAPAMEGITFTTGAAGMGGLGVDPTGNGQQGVGADAQAF